MADHMNRTGRILLSFLATTCLVAPGLAQSLAGLPDTTSSATGQNAPVNFTADKLSYNKTTNVVTASGHVIATQSGSTVRADQITIDRKTNVVTATGHVSLIQPNGGTVYTDHIILSDNMKNAIMTMVAARLANNVKIIANGGRRYDEQIEELTKPVYSACDLCKNDPRSSPLWSVRASSATRDLQHKMIEFRDATLLFKGVPIFWMPYFTEPDPSVKRQTGLLIPSFGVSSHLGAFIIIPYFITLGKSADLTVAPILATKRGPAGRVEYRQAFNHGNVDVQLSGGRDRGHFGKYILATSTFDLNQYWRTGFSYNHASNTNYLTDFSVLPPGFSDLESTVYLEGFSSASYARIEAQTFQGLVTSVDQSELPIIAPYAQYSFTSMPDKLLGGTFRLDTSAFNIIRHIGTSTRRFALIPSYSIPFTLPEGVVGTTRLQLDSAYYDASKLDQQPNYSALDHANTLRAQPYGAVMLRWPFIRPTTNWGSQLIEPIVQLVTSPNVGISKNDRIPNEDSLDLEFSDANLFSLNRYPGIDRLDGGSRVDYALHAAWYLPSGMMLDGLVGQSYRFHKDNDYLPASGLEDHVSDIVDRLVLAPTPWFNVSYRGRLSHKTLGNRMSDVAANFGTSLFNVSTGYLYTSTNPYTLYDDAVAGQVVNLDPPSSYFSPRKEITTNVSTNFGPWSLSGGVQRNLEINKFDNVSASAGWQNNCFGININFYKRFTEFNGDNGNTMVLVQFNFKTLGTVGFNSL